MTLPRLKLEPGFDGKTRFGRSHPNLGRLFTDILEAVEEIKCTVVEDSSKEA